jgi:hypothetical protein
MPAQHEFGRKCGQINATVSGYIGNNKYKRYSNGNKSSKTSSVALVKTAVGTMAMRQLLK